MYNESFSNVEYNEAYKHAARRVKAKMGFYGHLTSYVIVNGMLIVLYLLTSIAAGTLYYPWFIWVMLGWGIGLAFHYMGVFIFGDKDSPLGRQQMIEAEMRKMGASNYTTDRKN